MDTSGLNILSRDQQIMQEKQVCAYCKLFGISPKFASCAVFKCSTKECNEQVGSGATTYCSKCVVALNLCKFCYKKIPVDRDEFEKKYKERLELLKQDYERRVNNLAYKYKEILEMDKR